MADSFPDHRRERFLERSLPHDEESEKAILGAVLLDQSVLNQAILELVPEDFYSPFHRRVFGAMSTLFKESSNINSILIGDVIKRDGALESMGGVSSITNLSFGLPFFTDITDFIRIVKRKAVARNLIQACNATVTNTLSEDDDIESTLDAHEQKVHALRAGDQSVTHGMLGDLAFAQNSALIHRVNNNEVIQLGIRTGFAEFDEMTSGLMKTDSIILGGRPSMGKTAFALCLARNVTAIDPDLVVLVVSLEMSKEQLVNRMICQEAAVDSMRYRTGRLVTSEWQKVADAIVSFRSRKIIIEEKVPMSALDIRARARQVKAKYGRLDLIITDYIGLVKRGRGELRHELGEISRQQKFTAKELDVANVTLVQLSRKPDGRTDTTPLMSDIRECGNIEEDADVIGLLHRDEYYKWTIENQGTAKLIVAKNRNGPTGVVKLAFMKEHMRFADLYQE